MSENISIVLCTYNEIDSIENTIIKIKKEITNLELVIVDDNSSDGTIEVINKYYDNKKIKFILRKNVSGFASAVVDGIKNTSGNKIGWIDTNMPYLIDYIPKMDGKLNEESDIVILSRYVSGGKDKRPFLRSMASKVLNIFCKLIFRSKINDFTSGIFLMKRKILNEVSFNGYGHGDFFIEFLYNVEKKGFKVSEIPFVQEEDAHPDKSKSAPNLYKFLYLGMKYIIRIFATLFRKN
tara:strand:+ start:1850 stop:2560 length:711 start_codon:yes stop_codon:yes gene_type:complete